MLSLQIPLKPEALDPLNPCNSNSNEPPLALPLEAFLFHDLYSPAPSIPRRSGEAGQELEDLPPSRLSFLLQDHHSLMKPADDIAIRLQA